MLIRGLDMGSYNRESSRRTMCTIICRWRRYGMYRKHLPKSIVSCCGRLGVSCLQFCEKRKWVTFVQVSSDTSDEVDVFFYRLGRFASHSDLQFQSFILERRVAKFSFLVHFDILGLLPVFPLQILHQAYLPSRGDFDPSKLHFSCW